MRPIKQDEMNKFLDELQDIVDLASEWNVSKDVVKHEIQTILKCDCADGNCAEKILSRLQDANGTSSNLNQTPSFLNPLSLIKFIWMGLSFFIKLVFILLALYFFVSCHNPTQKFVMRHSQTLIYPVMRTVRLWTLPIVKRYNSLTEWHEEECLLKNPLFVEPPLDCWPCEGVRTLVDLTGLYNYSKAYCYNERPFLVRDFMTSEVTVSNLTEIYNSNKEALRRGTAKFVSNADNIESLDNLWNDSVVHEFPRDGHVAWKLNRVPAARVMRQVFRRPYFVPNNSEVALQRFIFVDGPEARQYQLPMTDFANVWIAQGQGYRLIILHPSEPCKQNCSVVSVLLKPRDVVYYNSQYWNPWSLPARLSDELSVTYMGSFY